MPEFQGPVRVAVIGAGYFGSFHYDAWSRMPEVELVGICTRHGTRIAVHENFRFQPWYRKIKQLLQDGILGNLYQIAFGLRPGDGQGLDAYLDRQPYFQKMPRLLVHETAVHWIDTFRYLMGETTGVYAQLQRLNPVIAGEDAGVILFDFKDGARGILDGNRLSDHVAENRRLTMGEMCIEGSRGTLRLDGQARIWFRPFGDNNEAQQQYNWNDHLFAGDCVYECNRHILEAWMAGAVPETEASTYIRNQIIEEAVYQSTETGRKIAV